MDYYTSLPINQIIANLADGDKPLLNSEIINLSDLNAEELASFIQTWPTIESKRRRKIIQRLLYLAEENFELNFDSIFKSCFKDEDAEIRCKAIEGLWENEEPSMIGLLVNLLERDNSDKVQTAAATALGKFAMLAELNKLSPSHTSRMEEALLSTINNDSKSLETKRRALEAVAPLTLPEVKKAIMEAYHSCDFRLRISSIYSMGKNCDHSWLPLLLKELTNSNAEIRYEAVGACGELDEAEVIPHIIELINDPDADVQLAAIQALGKIGGNLAKECLEDHRHESNIAIRDAAEQALREIEAKEEPLSFRDHEGIL